jgi:hypothetical protein
MSFILASGAGRVTRAAQGHRVDFAVEATGIIGSLARPGKHVPLNPAGRLGGSAIRPSSSTLQISEPTGKALGVSDGRRVQVGQEPADAQLDDARELCP